MNRLKRCNPDPNQYVDDEADVVESSFHLFGDQIERSTKTPQPR